MRGNDREKRWEESRGQDKKNGGKQEVGEENFEALEELGEGGNG